MRFGSVGGTVLAYPMEEAGVEDPRGSAVRMCGTQAPDDQNYAIVAALVYVGDEIAKLREALTPDPAPSGGPPEFKPISLENALVRRPVERPE